MHPNLRHNEHNPSVQIPKGVPDGIHLGDPPKDSKFGPKLPNVLVPHDNELFDLEQKYTV